MPDLEPDADREPVREPEHPVGEPAAPRPFIERLGLGAIALVLATLFAIMAAGAFQFGEPFLGVMSGIGCLMVLWVGGLTVLRGR